MIIVHGLYYIKKTQTENDVWRLQTK
jgi:hypothetical protein